MERHTLTLAVIIAGAAVIIGIQFQRLREARAEVTQVRARLAQAEAASPAGNPPAPGPAPIEQPSTPRPLPATPPPVSGPVSAQTPNRVTVSPSAIRKQLDLTEDETAEFMELLLSGGSKADMVALVGEEKYEQYEMFRASAVRQQRIRQVRDALEDTRHPLTDAQASQLDRLLAAEQQREAADNRPRPADPRAQLDHEEARLKAALASAERMANDASRFLDLQQTAILRNLFDANLGGQLDSLRVRIAAMELGER